VVCLQEVAVHQPGLPGGADEDQPARLRQLLPGYESAFAAGSDLPDGQGGRRQFGVMVLARRPLLQVLRHQLPWPADPGVPSMPRVALEVAVDLPGGPLRVVTTHLEYYSARQRAAQVEALLQIQADGHRHGVLPRSAAETDPPFRVLPRGQAAVFCGDFNFLAGSPEYECLQRPIAEDVPRLVDAWELAHPGLPHAPTAGVHGGFTPVPICCDFCFVSEQLAVAGMQVTADTDVSDHQPLLLTLVGLHQ